MSAKALRQIEKQLHRAISLLMHTQDTLFRITESLRPTEQALIRKEFETKTVVDRGESKVVLCLEEELASSKAFKKALSKIGKRKPTLVRIPEKSDSHLTNLTIARMIPSDVLASENGSVVIANIQKEKMLKHLEDKKAVIIGTRYLLDDKSTIGKLSESFVEKNMTVYTDNGLNGGGQLTYELVRTLEHRLNTSVVEITLSCSVAENSGMLEKVLQSLLSL